MPAAWPGFSLTWRRGANTWAVTVENPSHVQRGVAEVLLDDRRLDDHRIPLLDDGKTHRVRVVLGAPG